MKMIIASFQFHKIYQYPVLSLIIIVYITIIYSNPSGNTSMKYIQFYPISN